MSGEHPGYLCPCRYKIVQKFGNQSRYRITGLTGFMRIVTSAPLFILKSIDCHDANARTLTGAPHILWTIMINASQMWRQPSCVQWSSKQAVASPAMGHWSTCPSTSNKFIFSSHWSKSDSQLSKYCVVYEISWCRCQQLTALSISTALVTKLLVIEQLLHPALKSAVSAPWPKFQLCPSSQQILATPLEARISSVVVGTWKWKSGQWGWSPNGMGWHGVFADYDTCRWRHGGAARRGDGVWRPLCVALLRDDVLDATLH